MTKRADALDALRGFAIITMILSGSIPFGGPAALPGWMYHAQLPPPDFVFNPDYFFRVAHKRKSDKINSLL